MSNAKERRPQDPGIRSISCGDGKRVISGVGAKTVRRDPGPSPS